MTKRDIKKSRETLMEILAGIADHAAEQAFERCPYRNKQDECTAKFSCRNQRPAADDRVRDQCGHDGPFDYRAAWESKPRLYEKAKSDIAKIGSAGRAGRRQGRPARSVQSGDRLKERRVGATTLFDLAEARGSRLASSCKRLGECHECIVDVKAGMSALSPRSEDEAFLQDGFRLACQAAVLDEGADIAFEPLHRQAKILTVSRRRDVDLRPAVTREDNSVLYNGVRIGDYRGHIFGLAIDLGTTTIAMELIDLESGECREACSFENPQRFGGSDVLNRISYDRSAHHGELQNAVVSAVSREITAMGRRLGVSSGDVFEIVLAGNSTMRDMFFKLDVQGLGQKPYRSRIETEFRDGARDSTALLQRIRALGLRGHRQGKVFGLPLVGSHVGADTAAALSALDITADCDGITMLIDIGTNTEIVIAGRGRILAASCPAGPAFEGGLVTHGMPGHDGAIESVSFTEAGAIEFRTIGGGAPAGLCGSGLVDLLAELRRLEQMSPKGVLKGGKGNFEMTLVPEQGITLSAQDVSHLAQAKSASYCGQALLLQKFGIVPSDISKLYLAGGFANYINAANAIAIGFLAPVQEDRIVKVGNAALQGARELLLDASRRPAIDRLVRDIEHVELETAPEFFDLFVEGCQFKPMPANLGLPPVIAGAGS
jgi:uncharacterized 2Fe-2S/4Fe-4S cluster protein (DUF4445 family)